MSQTQTELNSHEKLQTISGLDPLHLEPPAWNNASEYPSVESNEFRLDLQHYNELFARLSSAVTRLKIPMSKALSGELPEPETLVLISELQALAETREQAHTLISNLLTFVSCSLDTDASNTHEQTLLASLREKFTHLGATLTPVSLFLDQCSESLLRAYLNHEHTAPEEYALRRSREIAHTRLSEPEEELLAKFRTHGIDAFGQLYKQISGNLRCRVINTDGSVSEMGLAQASGLLRDSSEARRKAAWTAIQAGWKEHEQAGAAILNGLAGWRIESCRLRSHTKPFSFLDIPVHGAGIRRQTLDALIEAVWNGSSIGRRAMRAMAQASGKKQLDPWDLLAGAPTNLAHSPSRRPYREGLNMIRDAFAHVDPSLGDFIHMMDRNRWIEGRVLPSKRQGAYCTAFAKSRTPRVFQTYMGSFNDIRTLAHELGHAYHAWVTRDLPKVRQRYPMTLAETASIFAETVLGEYLSHQSKDPAITLDIHWQDACDVASHLLNIPARYEFEKAFYERRETTAFCSPEELGDMTEAAWKKWYGDTLTQPERQFWMTKLHFSISGISFYNFPYVFGSLFSLAIYAKRAELGEDFLPVYVALLRDTGSMSAEELASKHLGEDISQPEFWQKSLIVLDKKIAAFEAMMQGSPKEH